MVIVQETERLEVVFNYPDETKIYKIPVKPGLYKIPHSTILGLDCSYINHDGSFFVWSYSNSKKSDVEITKYRKRPIVNNQCVVR